MILEIWETVEYPIHCHYSQSLLWPRVVVPVKILFMIQIICKLFLLDRNTWNYITVCIKLKKQLYEKCKYVVVMPWTILPRRNRRCVLSATGTRKPEEENDARGVTCFMEEHEISLREVARFDEHKRLSLKWKTAAFCWCLIGEHPSVHFAS